MLETAKSNFTKESYHSGANTSTVKDYSMLEWRQVVFSKVYEHNYAPEDMVRSSSTETFPDIKSPNPVMEKLQGSSCYLSPSKIPLPKCLEESPVRINRPRSEVRNKDLPAVENQKALIRKAAVVLSFQENEQSSEGRNSQLHGFLKLAEIQDGAIAALTPISINVLGGQNRESTAQDLRCVTEVDKPYQSASRGQDGRAKSEKIVESLPAPAVKHLPKSTFRQSDNQSSKSEEFLDAVKLTENSGQPIPSVALHNLLKDIPSSRIEQSSSSGECFDDLKFAKAEVLTSGICAESVEDGGSCEVQNVGQTVVWSNAVFCTDFCYEDSSSMESIYSTHCSPSESLCAAANTTVDVTGDLRTLSLSSSSELSSHSAISHLQNSFEKVSSKGLVGTLLDSSMVTLTVKSDLGSRDKVESENCMGTSDVTCTMVPGSATDPVTDRDRLNEPQCRNTAMDLELAATSSSPTFTMQAVDLNCMQKADVCEDPEDWALTKKILFRINDEDRNLVSEAALQSSPPVSSAGKTRTSIAEHHEQLTDFFKSSTQFENFGESVEQEACTMTNPREPSIKESMLQLALPPYALVQLSEAMVEGELEDEIQLEIEGEISREIIALSQKLANLQSRRRRNSKLPAISKSPGTSLLTPPAPMVTEENRPQNKSAGASTYNGGRQRGKRAVAAKFFKSVSTSKLASCPSPRSKGKACFGMKGKQMSSPHPGKWRMNLGLRLSFASNGNNSHKFARFCNDEHENSPLESNSMREEFTMQSPGNKLTQPGLTCPLAQPRTIRRFDWVKTLRSGESYSRMSPEARVSSRMYHQDTSTGRSLGREPRPKNLEGATGRWRHDLNRNKVEELGNLLNCDHRATPADAHMGPDLQGTRCGGRVVASRYASSSPPADVSTKSPTPDGDDFLGRTAHQILKAGSRRSLAVDKSLRSKPGRRVKSFCPNSQGGIRPRGNSTGPLCRGMPAMKPNFLPESQVQESGRDAIVAPKMWFEAPETYQTEYETFVDGPDNERNFAELFKASMRLHEDIPVSGFAVSGTKKIFPMLSPRGSFELSLPSHTKKNVISCTELSVSTKKKASRKSSMESSRNTSGFGRTPICTSMEKVIFSFRGSSCQRCVDGDENRHITELVITSPLSVKRLFVEDSPTSLETERRSGRKSIQFLRRVCRAARGAMSLRIDDQSPFIKKLVDIESGANEPSLEEEKIEPTTETMNLLRNIIFPEETFSSTYYDFFGSTPSSLRQFPGEEEFVQEPDTNLTLASSFSHERSLAAEDESVGGTEELVISGVTRARWKELFDALEKERRKLPRIRTTTGPKKKLGSPRDSGCVKRVSDRVKVMEYFSLDRLVTNLQRRGDHHLRTSESPACIGDTHSQTGQKNRLGRSPAR